MDVKIVDPQKVDFRSGSRGHLLVGGTVHPISAAIGTEQVKVNAIYFEPGARFIPHKHPFDQLLYYQYGTGIVAVDGGEDVIVPEGNYVLLPGNTVHMHGCTGDGPALQLSIMQDTQTTFDVEVPPQWQKWVDAMAVSDQA